MADIPTRLVQLRRDLDLTQQEMADRMGIHVNQVRRYESGKAKPSLEVLEKIALTLHVSLDWLVFGEDLRGPDDTLKLQFEAVVNAHSKLTLFATSKIDPLSSGVNINAQISSYDSSCGFVFNHVKVTPPDSFPSGDKSPP